MIRMIVILLLGVPLPLANGATLVVPTGAYPTIQDAIDAAVSGVDEVVVDPGVYGEVIDFLGKAIAVRSSGGAAVTTIDGTGLGDSVVKCVTGEGEDTFLEGFTVTGGTGNTTTFGIAVGGGMLNLQSEPTVIECVFTGNGAVLGGGMFNSEGGPRVTDCTFSANSATASGGGMYNGGGSDPPVMGCLFILNSSGSDGAGMYNTFSAPVLRHCVFDSNTASLSGGGIYSGNGISAIFNCVFVDNSATFHGGGLYSVSDVPLLLNCTLTGNGANAGGGGIYTLSSGSKVMNCILWGNSGGAFGGSGSPVVRFSDVQGGWAGAGSNNINADPQFVTGPQGDFYLSQSASGQGADSPCVDVGIGQASDLYVLGSTRTDEADDSGAMDMGFHYNGNLRPRTDVDGDGDVDGIDFSVFASCHNKAGNPPRTFGCGILETVRFDSDNDGDIDGGDFGRFASCFNMAGNPPRSLACPP